MMKKRGVLCDLVVALAVGVLGTVDAANLNAQPPGSKEVYRDFRDSRPLLPALELRGPDVGTVARPEKEDLRITLPKTRAVNQPIDVLLTFSLFGDFELTGGYELLLAEQPTKGYGLGVSLGVANDRDKFAQIGRMNRPKEGSIFAAECWHKSAKDYKFVSRATKVMAGQLRLTREGSKLIFSASDGPGQEFVKLYEKANFGAEEMTFARFQVTDGYSHRLGCGCASLGPPSPQPSHPRRRSPRGGFTGAIAGANGNAGIDPGTGCGRCLADGSWLGRLALSPPAQQGGKIGRRKTCRHRP